MSNADYSEMSFLLAALSDAIGEPVVLDAHGECVLEYEGSLDVVVAQVGEANMLSLRTSLTNVGQARDPAFLQAALSYNYTHLPPGYSIGMDAASGQLVLLALLDCAATSRDIFLKLAEGLLELAPTLRDYLAAATAASQARDIVETGTLA